MSSIKGQLIDKDCELIRVSAEKYRMTRKIKNSTITLFILNPNNVKDVKDLEKAKKLIAELKNPKKKVEAKKPEPQKPEPQKTEEVKK